MSYNAHDLSKRLLNALDNNYNVVDMHTVNEIISILEKFNITKELLETTRLGKHVNELRRKTADTQLARRAKVLVKRWRDLVIPTSSPGHVGQPTSNRSSAERSVRRLGGTPLTSPALTRQVVSPAVPSPRLSSRPAWGGYESDSQDVILVEDDTPTPAPTPAPTPQKPVKRPLSPATTIEEKKPKRDKKPKKRKDHAMEWGGRNGNAGARNGMRPAVDYTTLGRVKKVKTTQELLEQIQSRRATSPASPHSPDVMLIEPEVCPIKVDSPLRNGDSVTSAGAGVLPAGLVAPAECPPRGPLEEPREYVECTCDEETADEACPAARELAVAPTHVRALHHALLPGINGTRAPTHPHQFAVRPAAHPDYPELFNSVVPLYNYSDYADDYCVKNMARVPVCQYLPWREFAPDPPLVERPATPQPIVKEESDGEEEVDKEAVVHSEIKEEPSERLQPESDNDANEQNNCEVKSVTKMEVDSDFISEQQDHRTVERTKETVKCDLDGRTLYSLCETARSVIPYEYSQTSAAPVVTLPLDVDEVDAVLEDALQKAQDETELTEFGKPSRPENFTEWHECAQLGDLIALPYVVID